MFGARSYYSACMVCIVSFSAIACSSTTLKRSPHEIVGEAPKEAWRKVNNEEVLKIELETGAVYVELNSQFAPIHTFNIKQLAREKFYDGLNMYRFVEGFVAQGGNKSGDKTPSVAKKTLPAEFFYKTDERLPITSLEMIDGYAPVTGYLNGFAVAQTTNGTSTWQTHCTGVFAMARSNDANSGGTEFYITMAPIRYLDRNITVFGRVLDGMEHVYRLMRKPEPGKVFNPILGVRVLSDIQEQDKTQFLVFNTEHSEFKAFIESRKNRPEAWFIERPNYTDVCSVDIPTRKVTGG